MTEQERAEIGRQFDGVSGFKASDGPLVQWPPSLVVADVHACLEAERAS
jgi:hypothetical protein